MCSKGGGSPPVPSAASTTFNSTTQPSAFAGGLYTDFLNRANSLSNTPFNPAMLGQVAPLNAQQTQAGNQLFSLGMDLGNFDPAKVQSIMSPYTESVVNATQNWFNNQNAIQGNDLLSQGIRAGNAFGGDRAGVAEGILSGQQQLAQAPVIAGLRQAGYTQALDEYNKLKQFGIQGAGAALGWGSMEQAQSQREFDVAQQNAMMQSAYPFQTLNWYGSLLGGIAPLLGQTAFGSNNPPEQSGLATGLGAAAAGVGLASSLAGGFGPQGGKRGGVIRHRARGGLVPVYIRHNGGIIAGLAYGGDPDTSSDDDQTSKYSSPDVYQSDDTGRGGEGDVARESKQSDYGYSESRPKQSRFQIGKAFDRPSLGPQFPGFPGGSGGTQQQSTASQTSDWLKLGTSVGSAAAKLLPLLLVKRGGFIPHLQDGGFDPEDSSWTPPDISKPDTDTDTGLVPMPRERPSREDLSTREERRSEPPPIGSSQQPQLKASPATGPATVGKQTWFNPYPYRYTDPATGRTWTDTGAMNLREGKHASGLPITTPGFATAGSRGLGHWYEVTTPDGQKQVVQKTDIGPRGVVDLNAALASKLYGDPNAVASGRAAVRYLGPNRPEGLGDAQAAVNWPDPNKGNVIPGVPSSEAPATPNWQVPNTRMGGQQPSTAAGPLRDPDADAQQGGGDNFRLRNAGPGKWEIPNGPFNKPEKNWLQRASDNPFFQIGTRLMAAPGIKGREGQAIGRALLGAGEASQQTYKQQVLDAKPEIVDTGKGIFARVGNTYHDIGLPSPQTAKEEADLRKMAIAHGYKMEEKSAADLDNEGKTKPFHDSILGMRTGVGMGNGVWADAETGQILHDPRNPGARGQMPGQQQQQPATGLSPPPQQSPATGAPVTPPPRQTEQQQPQPPAQTAQTAGPQPDLATDTHPPETEEQKQLIAEGSARGGFKNPLKVGRNPGEVDPRILQSMGNISPAQFDGLAIRLANGDDSVLKGLGNKASAGMARSALRARANEWLEERYPGLGPQMANAAALEFAGKKAGARTFETQAASLIRASTAVEGNMPLLMAASAKVPRTEFPTLNSIILSGKKQIGDVDVAELTATRRTLVVNYAAALGRGNGQLTDYNIKKAEALLEEGYTHNQMERVLQIMRRELDNEKKYLEIGRDKYLGRPAPAKQLSPEDQAAVDWAKKNPQHPRAQEILRENGLQ